MKNYYFTLFILLFFLSACQESDKARISSLIKEWEGKEIIFPESICYTIYEKDTLGYSVPDSEFRVVSYIDSVGCTSCKLQLFRWKEFMAEVDSLLPGIAAFQFVFHPKKMERKELVFMLKRDRFNYPVWIDDTDSFNKQNRLPEHDIFHTFLLNRQNQIVAIGNPVLNIKIRELYLKILSGDMTDGKEASILTEVQIEKKIIDLGEFKWEKEQQVVFELENVGPNFLVINGITTSCGCVTVKYSKEPAQSGSSVQLVVTYRADRPEHLNKSLRVYCNTAESPLLLSVKGNAK